MTLVRPLTQQEELVPEYCEYFRDKSFEELDQLARSFHFGEFSQIQYYGAIHRYMG